jgi:hypothetical protein
MGWMGDGIGEEVGHVRGNANNPAFVGRGCGEKAIFCSMGSVAARGSFEVGAVADDDCGQDECDDAYGDEHVGLFA